MGLEWAESNKPSSHSLVGELEPTESSQFQRWLGQARKGAQVVNSYLLLHQIALPVGARRPAFQLGDDKLAPFSLELIGAELVHRMAQHCLCDGLAFSDLYQLASVAREMPLGTVYEAIFLAIGASMHSGAAQRPYSASQSTRWVDIPKLQFEPRPKIVVTGSSPSESGDWRCHWLTLESWPEHPYPLLDDLLSVNSLEQLKWSHLLYSLMAYLAYNPGARPTYEAAALRLSELIPAYAPRHQFVNGICQGPQFGPVDLDGEVLTLSWEESVLIGFARNGEGLNFQCYRPLCLDGCALLQDYCKQGPELWEVASQRHAASAAQSHRAQAGLTYRTRWAEGLRESLQPMTREQVWTQLAVAHLYEGVGDRQNSACQDLGFSG